MGGSALRDMIGQWCRLSAPALLILASLASPLHAEDSSPDVSPFVTHEVMPQVHLLSTPQDYFGPVIGNVTVIEQQDGFVIVDTGMTAGHGRTIVDFVRARSSKPVKAVLITHWHNDHPQGVSAIRDSWPEVRIIATPETKAGMVGPELGRAVGLEPTDAHYAAMEKLVEQATATFDKQLADPAVSADEKRRALKAKMDFEEFLAGYRGTYVVPPTETFTRELTIDDPDTPVRLLHIGRANTAGDAIAWLPRQKIIITGDMVVWPTPFGFFSYPSDWVQTLGRVKALGYSVLIPGHGEPQSGAAYVDQLIGSIEDIRTQVGPLASAGLSLDEVRSKVDFSAYAEIFGTTERRKRLFKSYWTEPMIENAWKEAKGLPIVQGEGEMTVATQSNEARKD